MGASPLCQRRCIGHSEMLLLLDRLALGPQWLPRSQFYSCLLRPSTCNDLRQVNIFHHHPTGRKLYWDANTRSAPLPDGSFTDEFTHHQKQALKWVCNINTAPLTRDETYTAYCTMWRPSFEFPLPVTSFTKKTV